MKRYALCAPALVLTLGACGRGEPGEIETVAVVDTVQVSAAAGGEKLQQLPARVVPARTAELATRATGTIEAVTVDVGTAVRAGQVLVRLDASGVEAAVASAEAQRDIARRTWERIRNLERDGAATGQELDQAEANLRMAEAGLMEAIGQREYVFLRAPFDGTVAARQADPGDLAVPGRPVLVLAGRPGVKIEADLPASLAGRVQVGDAATVLRQETGSSWQAVVTRVVPVVELSSHRFRVEARFAESDALPLPGTFARLELSAGDEASVWVPSDAVVRRGQLFGVFMPEGDHLRLRWVRTGQKRGDGVEVLAGLDSGALVVREPSSEFTDGIPVRHLRTVPWKWSGERER